jgi:hypothetical protein
MTWKFWKLFNAAHAAKEVAMGDNNAANPPAQSGGLNEEQVTSIFEKIVTKQLQPLAATIQGITETQKSQAESLGKLTDGLKAIESTAGKGAKPDEIAKLVADQLKAQQDQQAQQAAASTKKADVRKRVVEAKLKGVPDSLLASLPDTDDEKVLTEAADSLRKTIEGLPGVKLADVGGVSKEGGAAAGSDTTAKITPANSGLAPGVAAYADSLKIPGK